ncbi:MAG: hypothetical protein HFI26_08540 [Lachnospiraceae bacterium]|jgi:hypothetical protein|nr:hypothetical protein [Lachnospiraceae bacterium]
MAVASEKSFPFDSDQVNGVYDREYFADDFARFFRAFISSGTFMNEASNLQVIANGDMSVTLKPGSMIIDGYRYDNVADIIINISPADGVLKRIDRVSATWSKEDRDIHYVVREGVYSYEPVAPECRRTAEYKDYVVADIIVEAGAISIKQADIVDQRLNSEVCGLAIPFGKVDTSSLYDQIQAALEEFQNVNEKEFEEWFESIQDKLSEDQAGSLQNQIGLLEDLTTQTKNNLVAAINEINSKEIEVVDPMTAEEPGIAADAKMTGDALKELNAKIEVDKPHIEAGNVKCTFSSSVRTYSVKFKKPFKNPSVAFVVNSGALSANTRATIKSVSGNGFEYYTYSNVSENSSGTIYWIATERTDVE